jgi:hypothetical protein
VISAGYRNDPRTSLAPSAAVPRRTIFQMGDLLLPASLGLWALGVSQTDTATIGPYGLLTELPVVFYAGVALLVVSAAIELARQHPSTWRMSLHVVALVVMLYGTAPLVYPEGRYSWLYKTIGVVQYINVHGQLNSQIDIYQNWPGFFAFAAWFGKVAGIASPLGYAKWAQLVFELAAIPLLNLVYKTLSLTTKQRWLALLLYFASNWIGQDYFSPQALGTLLSLGIMAIAIQGLDLRRSSGAHRAGRAYRPDGGDELSVQGPTRYAGHPAPLRVTIVLLFFVLTFTHELSPYMLIIQLVALVIARLLRPRWLPIAFGAIAVGYLLPHFTYVNSHYGLLNSIGDFFRNAAPPSFEARAVPPSQLLIEHSAQLLSLGMWAMAIGGAWLRRRSGRTIVALALLAFAPFILLTVQHYGNEGTLRAYLFSLPWTAALAASGLVSKPASHRTAHAADVASGRPYLAWGTLLRILLALGFTTALFFPAFFGDDSFNVMSQNEVVTVTSFLDSATPGPVYCAIDNTALADTARYNLFSVRPIFGTSSLMNTSAVGPDVASVIAANALTYTNGRKPAYVILAPSMIAYSQAYGVTPVGSFTTLLSSLARSHSWKLLVDHSGTVIYELPPARSTPSRL